MSQHKINERKEYYSNICKNLIHKIEKNVEWKSMYRLGWWGSHSWSLRGKSLGIWAIENQFRFIFLDFRKMPIFCFCLAVIILIWFEKAQTHGKLQNKHHPNQYFNVLRVCLIIKRHRIYTKLVLAIINGMNVTLFCFRRPFIRQH